MIYWLEDLRGSNILLPVEFLGVPDMGCNTDVDASADASEACARLVSQHWPTAVPMQLPVPVPSHDLLLLLSSYEVCASHGNDLIILILSAPAYIANLISGPTHTTPLKSQALQVVDR